MSQIETTRALHEGPIYTDLSAGLLERVEMNSRVKWRSGQNPTVYRPGKYIIYIRRFNNEKVLSSGLGGKKAEGRHVTNDEFVRECMRMCPLNPTVDVSWNEVEITVGEDTILSGHIYEGIETVEPSCSVCRQEFDASAVGEAHCVKCGMPTVHDEPDWPTEQDVREYCGVYTTNVGIKKIDAHSLSVYRDRDDFGRWFGKMNGAKRIEPIPEQCIPKPKQPVERYHISFPLLAGVK